MDFEARVKAFIADAVAKGQNGYTLAELGQIFYALIELAVSAAKDLQNPGPQKKQLVMQAVAALFDAVVPLVPVPWWYVPFQPFVRPHLRALVLGVADGVIEKVYARVKD